MMKKLLAFLTAVLMTNGSAFAQPVSIKIFDATATFETGPNLPPIDAIFFGSTTVTLNIQPGDTFVISATDDGADPIVIDNFMTINRMVNVCESVSGQEFPDSCFGPILDESLPTGVPIETVLTPVGPLDVTAVLSALPRGTNEVVFELRDFGSIRGNTDIFLVIAGPGGGDPAGGLGPEPEGPAELQIQAGCRPDLNAFAAFVRNVGGQTSDPARGSINLTTLEGDVILNDPFRVPALDPFARRGDERILNDNIPTGDCPCELVIGLDGIKFGPEIVSRDACRL